jgi:erythritol kinase
MPLRNLYAVTIVPVDEGKGNRLRTLFSPKIHNHVPSGGEKRAGRRLLDGSETRGKAVFIGVDAGTSVVKVVAFDRDGQILAVETRPSVTTAPLPVYAEQDLESVIAAVGEAVQTVARCSRSPIDLLAITAQGDGLWFLNRDGRAVRPGILWSDVRAGHLVASWIESGLADEAYRRSGNVPFAGSAASLLVHLARHERASLETASTAGYCKDAINQRLLGARVTDVSDASLPFLDVRTRVYDRGLLDLFGLGDWMHLLAPLDPEQGVIRPLTPAGAEITGLPAGTPVHVGPFDFPATMIGAGVSEPGDGLIAFGTTLACGVVTNQVDTTGTPSGMTICLPEHGRWIRLLPAMAGTLALDWLLPLVASSHAELERLLVESEPGAGGVMMLPFLALSGERAPFVDPCARGRIVGLTTATTRADLARSVCEGIAYAARHCLEAAGFANTGRVTITGGGSRTSTLRQLLADVIGMPLLIARQPETGARGAVIAAARVAGESLDFERWTAPDGEITPDDSKRAFYQDGYQLYLAEIDRARLGWAGPVF